METLNIHAAKTHLSRLVERVEKGESFIIARAGKPVAMLQPLHAFDSIARSRSPGVEDSAASAPFKHQSAEAPPPEPTQKPRRRLGFLKGQMGIPDDFNEMGREEIERLFNGDE
jgi:prevent-host-death family protein